MASEKQVTRAEFVMVDGTVVVTQVLSSSSKVHEYISPILNDMIEREDMVVGLDITWSPTNRDNALLAFCTRMACVLFTVESGCCYSEYLKRFFRNKDITFVGVDTKDDIIRLSRLYQHVEIRNVVDVGELAAEELRQPRIRALSVRSLAYEVLWFPFKFKPRSLRIALSYRSDPKYMSADDMECVTTDAYAAYKIGKKLLSQNSSA